jgi:hypothetical protein
MKNTYRIILLLLLFSKNIEAQVYTAPANFSFTSAGTNAAFTTKYILVNSSTNLIAYLSTTNNFSAVAIGSYLMYAVNYDPSGTVPTLTVGTNLNAIGGSCVAKSASLTVTVNSTNINCGTNVSLSSTANDYSSGTTSISSSNTIAATNAISSTAIVNYQAANNISLSAGFIANPANGGYFTTIIAGCSATVSAITCASTVLSPSTATISTTYSGTATVPYTGGNGGAYSTQSVSSTGVTGLTAALSAGSFANGAGNAVYTVTGTPVASGTASFAIILGGQSCTFTLTVNAASSCVATSTACSSSSVANVVALANTFYNSLTPTQQATLQLTRTQALSIKWSNLPCGSSCRNGLQLSTLTTAQKTAALAIVQAATGTVANEGYDEITQILAADDVLGSAGGGGYSSGIYFIAFLNAPTTSGTWQLQFGGHHLATNITYENGGVAGATPKFEGVEPKSWTTSGITYTPISQEATAMANMLASFTTAQLTTAKTATTFSDVLLGPNQDGNFPATKIGIQVSALSSASQLLVLEAMKPWVKDADDETAACLLAIYQNELACTYVTYSKNTSGVSGNASSFFTANTDYVRIDGPSVWIEFVCQTGVVYPAEIHYHSIWRDHLRDYGMAY